MSLNALPMEYANHGKTKINISPGQFGLITQTIQKAIDSCAANGGGVVIFPAGTFLTGGFQMKSNVTLQLEKGAILQGSDKYSDYQNDAFIFGKDISNISIQGEGIIDGMDCYNPKGEEGFRGPHCIRLINCKNISFKGFTIIKSANWAINCRYCSYGSVDKIIIRGGHDGLHTRFCNNFTVTKCDFRTGDDAFAGNDNRDFKVTDCKINSSCNGFRTGCLNLTVERCIIWGPGEYMHKKSKRTNTESAFVHFSPKDGNTKAISGNWLIKNVTISGVDNVYVYNYENGKWMTGQPVTTVRFENVKADKVLNSFNITGDKERQFQLIIKNSSFKFDEGNVNNSMKYMGVPFISPAFFNINNFGSLELTNVTFEKSGKNPILNCSSGNKVKLHKVKYLPISNTDSFASDSILESIKKQ